MTSLDRREAVGGIALIVTGIAFAGYAGANYTIGSVLRMGPGMIPVALGVLLALFGGILTFGALGKEGRHPPIRIFVPAVILASVLAFGLLIGRFGLLPALAVSVFVATLAETPFRPAFSIALSAALCAIAWLVFIVALGLTIPLFVWPV